MSSTGKASRCALHEDSPTSRSACTPTSTKGFSTLLQCHFGRSQYYERRKGDIPLTPGEQELILDVLKQVGVSEELQFDQYEEAMDWSE